ncbi:MAG: hypothetical protein LBH05_00715 [Deferribacteraceae bacterium]|jgi:hypothetical protein|nr:hypothetical protein [Deferribacteraceae bacterium]
MYSFKSGCCFKRNGEPLTSFYSEYEAVDGARHVKIEHGTELTPYQCSVCNYWHLSRKDRQTPSKVCKYCVDSHKQPKQLYLTESSAKTRSEILEKEKGTMLKIYKCPYQKGFHLTKG